jgi:hypothetical protein
MIDATRSRVRTKFMQPITRVHTIFRLRTIVNSVTEMNLKGKKPRDDEIAKVLAERGLSKYRKQKVKDRIMRRARDHLLTASYMGLLTRTGRPFGYSSTTVGTLLSRYSFNEECPRDSFEEAIFVDKIMRLKLTNVYDLQMSCQYETLRSRPCLFVLYILEENPWLHEHQIAIATGGKKCDPLLIDRATKKLLKRISRYATQNKQGLARFYSSFKIRKEDRKNITRNIRPILDWCEALGLVESREYIPKSGRWYRLTVRGKRVKEIYAAKHPLWYVDLGDIPNVKSAILLFYGYMQMRGLSLRKKILAQRVQVGLISPKLLDIVKKMARQLKVQFSQNYAKLTTVLDFDFEYDIPPESRKEVSHFLGILCKLHGVSPKKLIRYLEREPIAKLGSAFQKENKAVKTLVTDDFSQTTGISGGSVLKKVRKLVPSIGVLSQYRSSFEKEVAILLRLLNLNAVKYQGQVSDRCAKRHVAKFFESNPDILILNGLESLVECKSSGEWHSPLSSEKGVQKEFIIYQKYMSEVRTNSVLIVYEGSLDHNSRRFVKSLLEDARDLVLVTKNFLVECVEKMSKRAKLIQTVKQPREFDALSRILVA